MQSADIDVLIIGAGVVGLAVACAVKDKSPGLQIMVAEKNQRPGQEVSSRNSGVIHAGIYYPSASLKASLCTEGNRLLYKFCADSQIPHRRTGKIIVAADEADISSLQKLYRQGLDNGVNLQWLDSAMVHSLEPEVHALAAIYSPDTGIVDVPLLVKALFYKARQQGTIIALNCPVDSLQRRDGFYEVSSGHDSISAKTVINCAGLQSDRIAALAGIDIDKSGYRLHYCKGDYYTMSRMPHYAHLIYPLPGITGLGIHTVSDMAGTYRLGPNSYYVEEIDYSVDDRGAEEFFNSARQYLPGLKRENISIDFAGIRPKLQAPGEDFRDFVISRENDKGCPGLINLIGIDSPGLTSSLALGKYVSNLLEVQYA